jgi:hypothetical protein
MELKVWLQSVQTQFGERGLLTWQTSEYPPLVLESHFDDAHNDVCECIARLRGWAQEIENTNDGMPVAALLEHIAYNIERHWDTGPRSYHLIERPVMVTFTQWATEHGEVEREGEIIKATI